MSSQENQAESATDPITFLSGGGEMGSLIRNFPWEKTPVGPIANWPSSLLTSVSILLNSRFPMFIFWGPEHICFYNDDYLPSLGPQKHPQALGARVRDVWPESWRDIEPLLEKAYAGEALYYENLPVQVFRNNVLQDVYWTSSYSPIRDQSGKINGCLVVCNETTQNIENYRKLQESEQLFRFATDATELGIWDVDPVNNVVTANKRLKNWFGLDETDDFPLDAAISNIAEPDRERVRLAIAKAMEFESGGTYHETYTIINPLTNTERIVRASGLTRFDKNKKPYRFNGTLQDVTELVQFNRKIEESERHFRSLITQSPIAKCLLRGDDFIVEIANEKMLDFWESSAEVIGRPVRDIQGQISNKTLDILISILQTGDTVSLNEVRRRHSDDGSISYYNLTFKPIVNPDKSIFGIMQTAIDVTDQVVARQKVEESERRFRSLIAQAPIAIGLFVGPDHIIETPNKAMTDILGKGPEVIGKKLRDVMPEIEAEGQPFLQIMDDVYQRGEVHNIYGAKVLIEKNGILTENYYDVTYSPICDANGDVYALLEIAIDVSEKILGQLQIVESEARFRNLVESAPLPIGVYTGEELRIFLANKTIMRIFGKGDDVVGKLYTDVLPELDPDIVQQLKNVYHTGEPFFAENARVDLNDGGIMRTYYFNYAFTPLRDSNGNIYGVLNTAADVTEINLARLTLEESEKNLRNVIIQAPVAMCMLRGSNYIIEIANDKMYEIWGRSEKILRGKPLFETIPELNGQGFDILLENVYKTGETYRAHGVPVTLPHEDGTKLLYTDFVFEAYRNPEGKIRGILAIAIDVTENVIARKKIEDAEQKARLAIDSAKLGTYEVNLLTDEIQTSDRFKEIWGVSREISRSEFAESIHPEDREARLRAHEIAVETGILKYECRVMQKDGSIHHVLVNGTIVKDDQDVPITLLGVIQDVTEQKLFAQELSKQVKDRTQELYRSNEDLMRFAHVASHDLKEPVRKIKVFSNMIEEQFGEHIPQKAHVYLEKVQNATDRMYAMIEGVLAYSALSASDQSIEKIDLNEVFGSIEVDFEILIQQKNAEISIDDLPSIEGAQVLIYQLFYNLVNNALKFSKENVPPEVTITAEDEGEFSKISITDNGIGLDPAYADKIFDAFARLNAKDKYEGTGLGLALCKKIVERHHGRINATGKVGVGSTFTVRLPRTQSGKLL